MKLTTEQIKEVISGKLDVSEKDIKRLSKKKNAQKQIERTFQVGGQEITVTSDETDEVIVSIKTEEEEEIDLDDDLDESDSDDDDDFEDEDFDEMDEEFMGSSDPKDYFFGVSKDIDKEFDGIAVIIGEKLSNGTFDTKDLYDATRRDNLIPKFLSDISGNDDCVLWTEDDTWTALKVIKAMEKKGFTYNNEIAFYLEENAENFHCDEDLKAYYKKDLPTAKEVHEARAKEYVFCLEKPQAGEDQRIVMVRKTHWEKEKTLHDTEDPSLRSLAWRLPDYVDNNYGDDFLIKFEGTDPKSDSEIIKEIESYGLTYSNDLASAMGPTFHKV